MKVTLYLSLLLLFLITEKQIFNVNGQYIRLDQTDGRYKDILVSINDDVAENWQLVAKIKESFQAASRSLSIATRLIGPTINGQNNTFAFGHVYILVPKHWSNRSVDALATWQRNDVAHFVISRAAQNINGGVPYTVQPGGCQQPGDYVHISNAHTLRTDTNLFGMELVHEFAHLRWGVFDEHNGQQGPHFYLQGRRIMPVRCSDGISGAFGLKDTGSPCQINRQTLEPEENCRFLPFSAGQTAGASIMYSTYIQSVKNFCKHNVSEARMRHNADAPNPHNRQCQNQAVDDVIRKHSDFTSGPKLREVDTTVDFTVIQERPFRQVVIIMDVSGSMKGNPLAKLKIATRKFLLNDLETGVQCGMLSFATDVITLQSLKSLSTSAIRRQYVNSVNNLVANGYTALGDATVAGMEMLGANLKSLNKNVTGYITLLTDGEDNRNKRFSFLEAIKLVKQTGIIVDTIAFGNKADKNLADLSRDTGGKAYFSSFQSSTNDLMNIMSFLVRDRVANKFKPIDLVSQDVVIDKQDATIKVKMDADSNQSPQFNLGTVPANNIATLDLEVVSPKGKVFNRITNSSQSIYEKDVTNGLISINPDIQEVGEWTVRVKTNNARRSAGFAITAAMTVSAKTAPDAEPVLLEGSVSPDVVQMLRSNTKVGIYAKYMKGSTPVKTENVSATIESDSGVAAEIFLLDDGAGADVTAGDGVYSAYVPPNKLLSVAQEYGVGIRTTAPYQRTSTAGKLEIKAVDASSRRPVPERVTDLKITRSYTSVRLEWTAVGAISDQGPVKTYLLSVASDSTKLLNDFVNQRNLSVKLEQKAPGQMYSVDIPSNNFQAFKDTFYIALIAESNNGAKSEVSNIVSTMFSEPENINDFSGNQGLAAYAIALIVVAVIIVLAAGAIVTAVYIKKRGPSVNV